MTAVPDSENSIANLIDAAHEARKEGPRPHLGGSLIGHPCDRWLWLSFRLAVIEEFPGRILRLFRRGQNEEAQIVSDLRAIGMHITDTGANQARVNFGKHFSGSIDGIGTYVPGGGTKKHILEFKTHSDKSFKAVAKDGVQKSKPQHWAQVQVYMLGRDIDRALYVAINKNDDHIYTERVKLDKKEAQKYVDRAHRITMAERMPEPLSHDPSWYQCKWCPGHHLCFTERLTKQINCRTCAHATPCEDSTWHCARHDAGGIPFDYQLTGCESHVLHPDLVPWKMLDSVSRWEAVYEIDGVPIRNGEGDANVFASAELVSNLNACLSVVRGEAPEIEGLRTVLGARVMG